MGRAGIRLIYILNLSFLFSFPFNLRLKDFTSYSNTHSQPIGFKTRGRSIKTQLLLNNIKSISSLIAFTIESYIFLEAQNFLKL